MSRVPRLMCDQPLAFMSVVPPARRHTTTGAPPLKLAEIGDQRGALERAEREECIAGLARLPTMGGDRVLERRRTPVVQVGGAPSDAPQWRGAELARAGL